MNTDDIIELAREAGFTQKNVFSDLIVRHSSGAWVDITDDLTRFAALVTQAERESRQAAQAENEQLKARLARSGAEMRKAVFAMREACAGVAQMANSAISGHEIADEIRTIDHIVDLNKKAPGLALDGGEFVQAESITDWSAT